MKYDVFISYSRRDYVDENENIIPDSLVKKILEFLDENDISYWFDKEGIYSGSEFVEVIANAIADSKMMLFVSSEHSNESIYTAGEIFEAIENQKLIIPVRIDDSKYNKKFKLLLNPLDYVDITKADAFSELLKAIEAEKARIAKLEHEEALRREELKKREWRKAVKGEILEQVNELKKLKDTRKALLESIYKKLRSIDVLQKQCPVCDTKTDIETEHCQTCGWFFPALTEIEGLGIEADKSALILAKSRWESKGIAENPDLETEIARLRDEIKELEKRNQRLTSQLNSQSSTLEKYKNENANLKYKSTKSFFQQNIIAYILIFIFGCIASFVSLLVIGMSNEDESTKNEQVIVTVHELEGVKSFDINGVNFNMIYVEGGSFMMGALDSDEDASDDEKPAHSVTLDSYYIAETEVTQELWQAVMGNNPSCFIGNDNPVESVSWNDCQDFVKKLNQLTGKNFALPTEAQWEYAARGGNRSRGYKYSGSNTIDSVAWYDGNCDVTHPVAQKQANELGIYDMSGNVLEWCDSYSRSNYNANPYSSNRVMRGGGWNFDAWDCRVACRGCYAPDGRCSFFGFRLVLQ